VPALFCPIHRGPRCDLGQSKVRWLASIENCFDDVRSKEGAANDHADVTLVKIGACSNCPATKRLSFDNLFIPLVRSSHGFDHCRDRSSRIVFPGAFENQSHLATTASDPALNIEDQGFFIRIGVVNDCCWRLGLQPPTSQHRAGRSFPSFKSIDDSRTTTHRGPATERSGTLPLLEPFRVSSPFVEQQRGASA
jgi:hypothetical protein